MEEFWEIISPLREGGTRCLQRVAKIDATLPPDILGLRRFRWHRLEDKPIHLARVRMDQ